MEDVYRYKKIKNNVYNFGLDPRYNIINYKEHKIEYFVSLNEMPKTIKLSEIRCNYDTHEVNIPLEMCSVNKKNMLGNLKFRNVKKFLVEIFEPWGEGIYIHDLKLTNQNFKDDSVFLN